MRIHSQRMLLRKPCAQSSRFDQLPYPIDRCTPVKIQESVLPCPKNLSGAQGMREKSLMKCTFQIVASLLSLQQIYGILGLSTVEGLTISSVTRCNREVGSLKDTGSVILVMSFPIIDLRILLVHVSGWSNNDLKEHLPIERSSVCCPLPS